VAAQLTAKDYPCLVAADAPVDTVTVDMAMFVGNMPALGKLPPSSTACAAGDAEPPLDESPHRIATGKAIAPVAPHLYDDRHAVWRSWHALDLAES
jgi:hypothetical protein